MAKIKNSEEIKKNKINVSNKNNKKEEIKKQKENLKNQDIEKKYIDCVVRCSSCGSELHTKSINSEITTDICSQCHPYYNGVITSRVIGKAKIFMDKVQKKEENLEKLKKQKNDK